ncbi:MAG: hypothetical protein LBC68_08080 [Prevotellaceae bacterium]|jgi:hypothetical protein|nr:hypothetical protein [Prevotellaceae bacterium]
MKDKILAILEQKFQGERKDGLNRLASIIALQVTTEDEANAIIGKFTADSVKTFVTEWRKEADAEIGKSNKTHEDNLRKKYDFTEKKTEQTPPVVTPENGNIDAAAIQKMLSDSIDKIVKPLQQTIESLKGEKTKETRLQSLNEKLNNCKDNILKTKILKDFGRMNFDSDDAFTEYLTDTEESIKTANQNVANNGLGAFSRPFVPGPGEKEGASKEKIDAVTAKLHI